MTDILYLRLGTPDGTPVEGLRVAADGSLRAAPRSAPLGAFAAEAAGCRLVALLPGAEALSTTARLPRMPVARLAQSLPYALEDQIAGELEAQHFALGKPLPRSAQHSLGAGLDVPVVVMRRERLAAWLERLRAAGLEPAALYLEDDCIAAKPGDLRVWLRGDEATLRMPGGEGLQARVEDLSTALDLLPAEPPRAALGLQIFGSAADRERHAATLQSVGEGFARLAWLDTQDSALPWLIGELPLARPVNLLQGEFAPRRTASVASRRWRLVAALVAALVLTHFADRTLEVRRVAAAEAALDRQLLQAVQASEPQVRSLADAQRLLGDGAARADRRASTADVFGALAALSAAAPGSGALHSLTLEPAPAGSDAGRRALRLEVSVGPAVDVLDASLRAAGWEVARESGDNGRGVLRLVRPMPGGAR